MIEVTSGREARFLAFSLKAERRLTDAERKEKHGGGAFKSASTVVDVILTFSQEVSWKKGYTKKSTDEKGSVEISYLGGIAADVLDFYGLKKPEIGYITERTTGPFVKDGRPLVAYHKDGDVHVATYAVL